MNKHLESKIDILLTDYCNQNCPFCFAREEMKSPLKKEISMGDIRLIVKKCIQSGVMNIALAGGEPTLHPRFIEIMNLFKKHFLRIHISTNGSFSNRITSYFTHLKRQVVLYINVSTLGFIFNRALRRLIIGHINRLSEVLSVSLVITSRFNNAKETMMILDLFEEKTLKKVAVRLGVEGVVAGEGNFNTIKDYYKIGPHFIRAFKYAKERGVQVITFGKSITPCMFTKKDMLFLKKMGYFKVVHCHPSSENRWFSVNPALETFMCYPLSTRDRLKISKDSNFQSIKRFYWSKQREYEQKYILPECKICPYYGLDEGKCPGPCAGFRINVLEKRFVVQ